MAWPLPYVNMILGRQDVILGRLDRQDATLGEILVRTKETNSRVTKLELRDAVLRDRSEQDSGRESVRVANGRARRNTLLGGAFGLFSGAAGYALLSLSGHALF